MQKLFSGPSQVGRSITKNHLISLPFLSWIDFTDLCVQCTILLYRSWENYIIGQTYIMKNMYLSIEKVKY